MRVYIAKQGESIFDLAYHFQVDLVAMLQANPNVWDPTYLHEGERVNVPPIPKKPEAFGCPGKQLQPVGCNFNQMEPSGIGPVKQPSYPMPQVPQIPHMGAYPPISYPNAHWQGYNVHGQMRSEQEEVIE